jgi:hypothetical protein
MRSGHLPKVTEAGLSRDSLVLEHATGVHVVKADVGQQTDGGMEHGVGRPIVDDELFRVVLDVVLGCERAHLEGELQVKVVGLHDRPFDGPLLEIQ